MRRALLLHPDTEVVFFLGDGVSDLEMLAEQNSAIAFFAVRGNCDHTSLFRGAPLKKTDSITLKNHKIVFTHGDLYMVKHSDEGLKALARAEHADLLLFGHTHTPFEKYVNLGLQNTYFFNPGSIGGAYGNATSYGVITMDEKNILLSFGSFA